MAFYLSAHEYVATTAGNISKDSWTAIKKNKISQLVIKRVRLFLERVYSMEQSPISEVLFHLE